MSVALQTTPSRLVSQKFRNILPDKIGKLTDGSENLIIVVELKNCVA